MQLFSLLRSLVLLTFTLIPFIAFSETWNDVDSGWETASNWTPATVPNAADATATFGPGLTTARTSFISSNIDVGTMEFISDHTVLISGAGLLTVHSAITSSGTNSNSFQVQVALNGSIDITVNNSFVNLSLISGTGGITKLGSSQVGFAGGSPNTYTGATVLQAGTLVIQKSSDVVAIPGDLTITGGLLFLGNPGQIANTSLVTLTSGTFDLNNIPETIGSLNFQGGSILDHGSTLSLASTGTALTMTGGITISGPLALTGASGGNVVFDPLVAGTAVISGTLDLGGVSRTVNIDVDDPNPLMNISGVISSGTAGVGLIKSGEGILQLSGVNTYTGPTEIQEGRIQVSADNQLGAGTEIIFSTTNNPALWTTASFSTAKNISAETSLEFYVDPSTTFTISGVISGLGNQITKQSAGTLSYTGTSANTYPGDTVISEGTLSLGKTGVNAIGGDVFISSGTLLLAAADQIEDSVTVSISGTGTFDMNGNNETIRRLDFQAGTLSQGGGVLSLSSSTGSALTMGEVTISGTVNLTGASEGDVEFDPISNGTAVISGTLDLGSVTRTFDIPNRSASIDMNVSGIITETATAGINKIEEGNLTFSGGSANTYTGLTTISEGTLSLNKTAGTNAIAGDTLINGGTLSLAAANQIANTSNMTLSSGEFDLNNNAETFTSLTFTGGNFSNNTSSLTLISTGTALTMGDGVSLQGQLNLTGGSGGNIVYNGTTTLSTIETIDLGTVTRIFDIGSGAADPDLTITGAITETASAGITKNGAGVLSLNAANTYTGTSTINAGTLRLTGVASTLGTNTDLTINGGSFEIAASAGPKTIGTLSGGGSGINLNNNTLSIPDGTFSGVISGTGGMTKTTAGTLSLTGASANTYTGTTTVTAGTLSLGKTDGINAIAGNIEVDGGTLLLTNPNQINSTSSMILSSGTFDLNNNSEAMASLIFSSGTITNNTGFLALASTGTALSINDGLSFPGQLNLTGASGGEIFYVGTTTTATIDAIDLAGVIRNFNVTNGADAIDLSVTGVISGAGGVNKTSTGVLDFSGSNSYTGATTISNGMLSLTGSGTLGNNSSLTINTGSFVITTGAGSKTIGTLSGSGSGINLNDNTLTIPDGSFSGDISGSGGITKGTAGTLTFSGATAYTGTTTINGGTLELSGAGTLGGLGPLTINAGTFTLAPDAGSKTIGTLSGGGSGIDLNNNTLSIPDGTFSGVISGTGGISKITAEAFSLTGTSANTYTGMTTISAGTLSLGKTDGINAIAGDITINGGTLSLTNSNQIASTSVMTLSSGTFDLNNNNEEMASLVFNNGTIANNTGFLALDSSGTALSINDGLSFPGQLNLTGASGGEISYVGTTTMATIEAIDLAGVTRTFNVANGTDAVDLSITGEISGAGGVSKTGAGVLDFSVSNSYTGATTINNGTLSLTDAGTLGDNSPLTINTGSFVITTGAGARTIGTLSGGGSGISLNNNTLTIPDGSFSGGISGSGGITKSAAGTLTLSEATTYTGATIINGGDLTLSGAGTLGNSSPLTINAGIFTLATGAGSKTIGALSGGGSGINLNNNTLTIPSGTFAGDILGSGGVTKSTAGTLTLSAATTYTGTTTINAGTLIISGTGTLGNSSPLTINGGSFEITAGATGEKTIGNLTGGGSGIDINDNTLNIPSGSFSGTITGTGTLNKISDETLTLTGTGLLAGGTTNISAGTLIINNSFMVDNLNVLSGGTLGGTGTITGIVTANSGSTVSPGTSIGTVFIIGPYTQSSGSTLEIEIEPFGTSDVLNVVGQVTIDPGAILELVPLPGVYLPGTTYTVITSSINVNGTYDTIIFPLTTLQASVRTLGMIVQVALLEVGGFVGITDIVTGNAKAVARCLENQPVMPGSDLELIAESLQPLFDDPSEMQNALDQMQPAIFGALNLIQESQMTLMQSAFTHRFEAWGNSQCSPLSPNRWNLWVKPLGEWIDQENKGQNVGYDSNTYGFMLGADRKLIQNWHVGIAGGYGYNHVNWQKSRGKVHSNNGYLGAYGFWQDENFHALASIISGFNHYSGFRKVHFDAIDREINHSNNGFGVGGQFEGAYGFKRGHLRIQPFGCLELSYSFQNSYQESGGDVLNLKVDSKSSDHFRSNLGVDFSYCFKSRKGQIVPNAYLGWVFETELKNGQMTATFKQLHCTMEVNAFKPTRSLFAPGIGLTGVFHDSQLSLDLRWDGEFGNRYSNQKVLLEGTYGF